VVGASEGALSTTATPPGRSQGPGLWRSRVGLGAMWREGGKEGEAGRHDMLQVANIDGRHTAPPVKTTMLAR
jgi:hypothetical protein